MRVALDFLAQVPPVIQINENVPSATGSVVIVLVRFAAGIFVGLAICWAVRNRFSGWHAKYGLIRVGAFIGEKFCVLAIGILTGVFELWKKTSFQTDDRFLLTVYVVVGFLSAYAIGQSWLVSNAKDNDKVTIQSLKTEAEQAIAQRDASLEAVGAIGAVIEVKKQRLAKIMVGEGDITFGALPDALGPKVQVFTLIKSLHQQFARHIPAPSRLRVGIYMRSPENQQLLAPLYSWDGTKDNCFSNSHPGYMRLDSPGGAQSLVVQCFRSESALHMVADCSAAEKQSKFVFFSPAQRENLKSMVAYRYNLHHSDKPDALILTMDTDYPGFFAATCEFQCQLLLQETGRRLELELIALDLIKRLPLPPP